jgi:DNA polymerase-3 subunit beta
MLKAAACCASSDDTRYYLNGVHVEPRAGEVRFCATDGHKLIVLRQLGEFEAGEAFIVPLELIAQLKVNKRLPDCKLELATGNDDGIKRVTVTVLGGTQFTAPAVDGTFPDYDRVIPSTVSGKVAQFNALENVAPFQKAAKLLGGIGACAAISHNGGGPALVRFGDLEQGFGVIMPLRTDDVLEAPPTWFRPAVEAPAAAAAA